MVPSVSVITGFDCIKNDNLPMIMSFVNRIEINNKLVIKALIKFKI